MKEGGTWVTMYQDLPQVKSNPHALHAHNMVVASPGRTSTLRHPTGINCEDYNDDQQHHDLRLHLCQVQAWKPPQHFLPNCTHQPTNCMDPLNIILDSCALREIPLPTVSQIYQGIHWNQQSRGPDRFWHLYAVHSLGFGIHSLHLSLLRSLHRVQTPRKIGQYRSQCYWGGH